MASRETQFGFRQKRGQRRGQRVRSAAELAKSTAPLPASSQGTLLAPGSAKLFGARFPGERRQRKGRDAVRTGLQAALLGSETVAPSSFRRREGEEIARGLRAAFRGRRR